MKYFNSSTKLMNAWFNKQGHQRTCKNKSHKYFYVLSILIVITILALNLLIEDLNSFYMVLSVAVLSLTVFVIYYTQILPYKNLTVDLATQDLASATMTIYDDSVSVLVNKQSSTPEVFQVKFKDIESIQIDIEQLCFCIKGYIRVDNNKVISCDSIYSLIIPFIFEDIFDIMKSLQDNTRIELDLAG